MAGLHLAVVPVGKLDPDEVEVALARAVKVWRRPIELREAVSVPHGAEDIERGQHRAATLMSLLRQEAAKRGPGKLVGSDDPAGPPPKAGGLVFVTDVDLFTASTEGVTSALVRAQGCAVISVRRLREAFYRRPAEPQRQRSRLVKEILRMAGRLSGLAECRDPVCVLAPSKGTPDLDIRQERFCRTCERVLFQGRVQL